MVIVVVGAPAGWGVWYWGFPHNKDPEYRTVVVARGDLTQAVTASGSLNPVVNVEIGSQISGIISKLYADFNSPVTNGQIIAQLDPATFKAVRDQAEGELENSKAALELSQVEKKRADELYNAKLISQSDYDKAVADLHQAQANVMIKNASLEQAQVNLNRATIYAPIDGVVISRNVDVGQTVAASLSAPTLFVIANDLAKMQIDASVSEADVGGIELGQNVNFTVDAFPYRTFRGSVLQVRNAAATNQNVVTYDTVISVNNRDLKLKPGMTANVSIVTAQRTNVVKIPNSALRFRPPEVAAVTPKDTNAGVVGTNAAVASVDNPPAAGGGGNGGGRRGGGGPGGGKPRGERPNSNRTVYILADGDAATGKKPTAQPVQIKTGINDGISTEVTEGLQEGDTVITGQSAGSTSAQPAQTNPFGGQRRFGG
ncbi:MAG: Efflux transporter, family, subunit [Pedosphaera sp.]|nr:Efflux transporter, family, subunit [Pedosphaera sp.]